MKYIITACLLLCFSFVFAQNNAPAPAQEQPIAITGATAHLGNGEVIENSLIIFENGVITSVATFSPRANLEGRRVIDASGKHIYPGLIAPNTQLGLTEIGAVRATHDEREVGQMNPNLRAIIAYNTDSQVTPTVRSRGVLYAQTTPQGGTISGTSSIVNLDAWNWEDAALVADDGLHLYWPRRFRWSWRTRTVSSNKNFNEEVQGITTFFNESQAYCATDEHADENLKLAAMCDVLNGGRRLFIHADLAKDIEQAIILAKNYNLDIVIIGGRDSYQVTDVLKESNTPVILSSTHNLPAHPDSDVDQPFRTPALLHDAGILFSIGHSGYWEQRNLPFQAGTAVAYGLPYEAAITALTSNTAKILGVDDKIGTIAVGKQASIIICTGDILDMRTSQVEQAFIDGRDVNLDNKQEFLYRKFRDKYERE